MSEGPPTLVLQVATLGGPVHLIRWIGTIQQFYRTMKADGYMSVQVGETVVGFVPWHAIGQVTIAPPEMLAQTETKGNA